MLRLQKKTIQSHTLATYEGRMKCTKCYMYRQKHVLSFQNEIKSCRVLQTTELHLKHSMKLPVQIIYSENIKYVCIVNVSCSNIYN